METPVIRYNLKDRGRQHTGQHRNFNIKAICDAINGPACQEMVASRGMLGFYGHLPRVRYGMAPVEGGIEGGKYAPVEPAIVTTYLKADYDGNVEHRAQFLDTAAGRLAAKLWEEKVGGFSSAIDQSRPEFYGFDYVAQPNYLNNSFRGIALDEIRFTDLFKVMFKEFRISLIVGAFLAVANGVRIFIQYHNPGLAVVIACSLMGTVIMAKLVGCILPLLAKKVNLDPAIMASPLITTLVDTFSILIYFNIATVLFRL